MNNVIFLYGEDSYTANQHLKAIKAKYISVSMGDVNLSQLDGAKLSASELNQQLRTLPFLANKRLVILRNALGSKNKSLTEDLIETVKLTPSTTVLVIFETKVDKRIAAFKGLNKIANVKTFPLMDEITCKKWINNQVKRTGGSINQLSVGLLFDWVGPDLWRLKQEIDKLVAYNPTITEETIRLLTQPNTQTIIFTLSDEILKGSLDKSLQILDHLRSQGENDIYLFSMILSGYRNLLKISLAQAQGITNPRSLKDATKLHPFVISKSLSLVNRTNLVQLTQKYKKFVDIDLAIKTGTMEAGPALDVLVAGLV